MSHAQSPSIINVLEKIEREPDRAATPRDEFCKFLKKSDRSAMEDPLTPVLDFPRRVLLLLAIENRNLHRANIHRTYEARRLFD